MVNIKIPLFVWPNHKFSRLLHFDPTKVRFFFSIFDSYNNEEDNSNACYSNKEEHSMPS